MNDTSAVPAGSIFDSFQKLTERPVIKQGTTKQSNIASLANSDSFKALQEVIDQWIKDLEHISVDPKKDDVTSVGFRYLASRVTIEYLERLRDMPKRYADMKKAEEENE